MEDKMIIKNLKFKIQNLILIIFFMLGLILFNQKNLLAQTKNLKPTAQSYFLEGNLLFNQGKYQEAIIKFKKALELDPQMAQAYYNIGVVYQQQGSTYYNLAIKWYKEALKKNNKLIHSYYNLGVIYFDLGDYQAALKQFEIARQLSPQDKSILDALRATKKIIAKVEKIKQEKKKEEEENKNKQAALKQKTDTQKQQQAKTQNKNIKSVTSNNKNQVSIKNQLANKKNLGQNQKQEPTNKNKNPVLIQKSLTSPVKAKQKTPDTQTTTKPNTSVLPQVKIKNVPPQKYQVVKIVTCKNVANKNPVKETNLFSSQDKEIYLWINFANLNKKHNINTKWYAPDGKVFFSTSGAINPAGGRYRYWVSKKLAGTALANLKGKWKIEVILDNQKVGETRFQIGN